MFQTMQRRINLGVIAATAVVPAPLLIIFLIERDWPGVIGSATGLLVIGGLLFAYVRGWDYARYAVVIAATLIIAFALTKRALTEYVHPLVFMAPALALVLTSRPWVIGAGVAVYALALFRAGFEGLYATPEMIMSYAVVVGTMVLSRYALDYSWRSVKTSAAEAQAHAERATEALALTRQQAEDLARRNDEQERLLELVSSLETPVVAIAEGVVIAPIIGHLDSRRAGELTGRLLRTVDARRAHMLILDLTGVALVDSSVAAALDRLIRGVRLLGCRVTITGVAPAVAATLATLGIGFEGVGMAATPQQALGGLVVAGGA